MGINRSAKIKALTGSRQVAKENKYALRLWAFALEHEFSGNPLKAAMQKGL